MPATPCRTVLPRNHLTRSCDALLRSSASLQKPLWRCGDAGKGLEALSAVKWRAIEIAFLLMQHEPRTSSVEHRFRHEFLAFLPHLDAFDVSKYGCEPYTQPCTSTMLTNSWRASSRHPQIPTLSRSVGRVFEWCILASAFFILVSSLLSESLCTP